MAEKIRKTVPGFYYGLLIQQDKIKEGGCLRGYVDYAEISLCQLGTLHKTSAIHIGVKEDACYMYIVCQSDYSSWLSKNLCQELVRGIKEQVGLDSQYKYYNETMEEWSIAFHNEKDIVETCRYLVSKMKDMPYKRYGKPTTLLYNSQTFTAQLKKHIGVTLRQEADGSYVYIAPQDSIKGTDGMLRNNSILEPVIANYLTQHDGETYTDERLAEILKETYEHAENGNQTLAVHNFAMLYALHINNGEQLSIKAIGTNRLVTVLNDGKKIGLYLRSLLHNSNAEDIASEPTDYTKYLRALRTKPFMLLAGISGTGKSRIVRELAFRSCPAELQDKDGTTPGNYLMVEVKPNWHDSSEILGYYSNISKHYQFTKFVSFLIKAKMYPNVPFFVCLDEMNLAPVEQYFAEFLSILETRKKIQNTNQIHTGVLVDAKYFKDQIPGMQIDGNVCRFLNPGTPMIDDDLYSGTTLFDKGLTLPENVFIIGTVNMDDTTHQFSRKVIDRAMTIEMNGEDLRKMFGGSKNMTYTEDWTLADFQPKYVQADEVVSKHGDMLKTDLPERLGAINKALAGTPFEVSYRVLNELCIYLGVLLDEHVPYQQAVKDAVDRILLMKILPRVEGDMEMFALSNEERDVQTDKTITNKLEWLAAICKEDYPESYGKILEMNKRLSNGFTRFWP